jgi:hypothetical protein
MATDFARGRVLALLLPIPAWLFLSVALSPLLDPESALGVSLLFLLCLGVAQLSYLLPIATVQLVRRRIDYARGMARGAGIVASANLIGWGVGWWMGVW